MRAHNQHSETRRPSDRDAIVTTGPAVSSPPVRIMDRGAPHWVFGASVVFMVLTVAVALIGDRRSADRRRLLASPIGSTSR